MKLYVAKTVEPWQRRSQDRAEFFRVPQRTQRTRRVEKKGLCVLCVSVAQRLSVALGHALDVAVGKLVDLVRLRSGALQDDVAVVLCRKREVEPPSDR